MGVLAIAFVRYQLGAAPPEEPISGRLGKWPILKALFLVDCGATNFPRTSACGYDIEHDTMYKW